MSLFATHGAVGSAFLGFAASLPLRLILNVAHGSLPTFDQSAANDSKERISLKNSEILTSRFSGKSLSFRKVR